jgi:hypothetical protein
MSRWTIEKSGTGIEKSGTGIEKSGTGIEKAGTGIRAGLLALSMASVIGAGTVQAGALDPAGSLQIVVNGDSVAVSWIIGDSVFSGVSSLNGTFASLMLTEVSLQSPVDNLDVTGGGTGSDVEVTGGGTGSSVQVTGGGTGSSVKVTGGGTGSSVQVTGGGTGSSVQVTGGGTGSSVQVTGGGTGSSVQVTGGGTGSNVQVTGGGTGSNVLVTGGGTGSSTDVTGGGTGSSVLVTGGGTGSEILVTGGGTGSEAIAITLPTDTGISMEVSVNCSMASVAIVDEYSVPIVSFDNVRIVGGDRNCSDFSSSGGLIPWNSSYDLGN